MSIGRGAASLGISFLIGVFVSAFVSMTVETVGTSISGEWLGVILLGVTAGSFLPVHHLIWRRISSREAVDSREEIVNARPPGSDSQR